MEELIPSKNFVINSEGEPAELSFDVQSKSVQELKEMGFSEVSSLQFKPNKRSGRLEPDLDSAEREKLRTAFEQETQVD